MPSIYTRLIFFTTEVVALLLFVEREKAGVRSHPPGADKPAKGGQDLTQHEKARANTQVDTMYLYLPLNGRFLLTQQQKPLYYMRDRHFP